MLSKTNLDLLNKYGWKVEHYLDRSDFSVLSNEGSRIESSAEALDFLLEDLSERELDTIVRPLVPIEEILNMYDYTLICESPLEISRKHNEKTFITGEAALILVSNLRGKHFVSQLKTTTD